MAKAMVSPLHRVIDAVRWDAERLLGRLIILVHAAFLDAGFVPLPHRRRSRKPEGRSVPRQAGRTASSLSLRYGAPQLQRRRPPEPEEEVAAVLRILAHGRRHLILYVQCDASWPAVERCVVVDALAAAPLLSGELDGTARALRSDERLAGLWRRLSDDLCRAALVDAVCRRNGGGGPEPSFVSLPGDAKAAILARLADGADLARVECVCAGLRRLVAERDGELWKARYDALMLCRRVSGSLAAADDYCGGGHHSSPPPVMSWKERYVRARRCQPPTTPTSSVVARYGQYTFRHRVLGVIVRIAPSIGMTRRNWQETQSLTEEIIAADL